MQIINQNKTTNQIFTKQCVVYYFDLRSIVTRIRQWAKFNIERKWETVSNSFSNKTVDLKFHPNEWWVRERARVKHMRGLKSWDWNFWSEAKKLPNRKAKAELCRNSNSQPSNKLGRKTRAKTRSVQNVIRLLSLRLTLVSVYVLFSFKFDDNYVVLNTYIFINVKILYE